MVRVRRRIGREEIDQLIQEDPFCQGKIADDEVIDFRRLKFSPSLAFLEKDNSEILRTPE
jgi:hypothetical protein